MPLRLGALQDALIDGETRPELTARAAEDLAGHKGAIANRAALTAFLSLLSGAVASVAAQPAKQTAIGNADEAAIRAILADGAAGRRNPHVSASLDWENAFGVRYNDLTKRDAFYAEVVKPLQNNSVHTRLELRIRFITTDVAMADEYWHIIGQLDVATGNPGPDRWGRTTTIFTRANHEWTEVAERVADLRYAYYHHFDTLPKAAAIPASILARDAGTYAFADNRGRRTVTVAGDHLTIASAKSTRVAIPVSETDFLLFDPADLAEYSKLHFSADKGSGDTITLSDEAGDVEGTLVRRK